MKICSYECGKVGSLRCSSCRVCAAGCVKPEANIFTSPEYDAIQ